MDGSSFARRESPVHTAADFFADSIFCHYLKDAGKRIGHCACKKKRAVKRGMLQARHHKLNTAPHQAAYDHSGDQRDIHRPISAGENTV